MEQALKAEDFYKLTCLNTLKLEDAIIEQINKIIEARKEKVGLVSMQMQILSAEKVPTNSKEKKMALRYNKRNDRDKIAFCVLNPNETSGFKSIYVDQLVKDLSLNKVYLDFNKDNGIVKIRTLIMENRYKNVKVLRQQLN